MTIQKSGVNTVDQRTAVQNLKKPSTQVVVGDVSTEKEGIVPKEDSSDLSNDTSTSESEDEKEVLRKLRAVSPALPSTRGRNVATAIEKTPLEQDTNAKKVRREIPWTICLSHCRYEVVRNVSRKYGLYEVNEDEQWNIYWTDYSVSIERAMDMRRYQLINHFPGMNEICRKDLLARNLNRMKALFGSHYDIYPKTWSLPADLHELQNYALCKRNKIYICKPEMGCQGRGIFLIRNIKDLNPFGKIVCQLYLTKPFLIDGYKFDLRLYVLITSCDPLRIYLYKEGLARFATARYKPPTNNNNTENSYMHLTNYAVNKFSRDYIVDDDCGSKRRLTAFWKWLSEHGHNVDAVCEEIDDVIIKTILSAAPILKQNYKYCFPDRTSASACLEILGFDIIFDHKLKPYVLEVNHSPSFHTDARLDLEIKEGLLNDTFAMLHFKHLARPKMRNGTATRDGRAATAIETEDNAFDAEAQAFHELSNCGGFRLIHAGQSCDKYDRYLVQRGNIMMEGRTTTAAPIAPNLPKIASEIKPAFSVAEEEPRPQSRVLQPKDSNNTNLKEKLPPIERPQVQTARITIEPRNQTQFRTPKIPVPIRHKLGSFTANFIKPEEEFERTKEIMQRGMLIRSLGIELQVFRLLKDLGTIKAEEEKMYKHLYENGEKAATKDHDE